MKNSQPSPRHLRTADFLRLNGIITGSFPLKYQEQIQREREALGHWFNAEGMLVNNQGEGSDSKPVSWWDELPARN